MAVRIKNFGGVLQELAPGASLDRDELRIVFCRTSKRWNYLLYVIRGLLRLQWNVAGIELARAHAVSCQYLNDPSKGNATGSKIYVETDGELVGTLPAEISVVPNALAVLAPRK